MARAARTLTLILIILGAMAAGAWLFARRRSARAGTRNAPWQPPWPTPEPPAPAAAPAPESGMAAAPEEPLPTPAGAPPDAEGQQQPLVDLEDTAEEPALSTVESISTEPASGSAVEGAAISPVESGAQGLDAPDENPPAREQPAEENLLLDAFDRYASEDDVIHPPVETAPPQQAVEFAVEPPSQEAVEASEEPQPLPDESFAEPPSQEAAEASEEPQPWEDESSAQPPSQEAVEASEEPQRWADEPLREQTQPGPTMTIEGIPAPEAAAPAATGTTSQAPARTADSHLDEGNVYFNVGQYILAIECYTRAIEMQPDLVAAFYNRANARTRLGHYGQALADYDAALQLDRSDADALNNRGMLHLYRADYAAALHDFDRAIEIDPGDTTIMVNRGLAHLHGGDAAAALSDFTAAAVADAGDAAAHYGCAQATATLGDREAALDHLKTALSLDSAYAREAAADPKLASLQGDAEFLRLLRGAGAPPAG